ncbi:hypothetical protein NQZ68_027885 [Dissostichus eleginoides]|nr:hypothetical protein NQZ68_027885 [Dissostichus eleginoides]
MESGERPLGCEGAREDETIFFGACHYAAVSSGWLRLARWFGPNPGKLGEVASLLCHSLGGRSVNGSI